MASSRDVTVAIEGLGKLSILKEITEGANAYSFRAHHEILQRNVFLKVFYYSSEASHELLREPRVLVAATDADPPPPNLVRVFEADVIAVGSDRYVCLQLEYVNGCSLLNAINRNEFGQQDAVRITSGILQGLSRLHSLRILHRDLKPANVMLDSMVPKITDFGSVAVLQSDSVSVPASKHSSLYVPPEGWNNPSIYSQVSDLYQIGMVLYELVNGPMNYSQEVYVTNKLLKEPKKSGRTFESLDDCEKCQICDKGIASLARKGKLLEAGRDPRAYFSDKIARIVRVATHPLPERRFQSAAQFIAALNKVDLPNWRQVDETEYLAIGWHGWDWNVSRESDKWVIKKARATPGLFRRIPGGTFSQIDHAFGLVEKA